MFISIKGKMKIDNGMNTKEISFSLVPGYIYIFKKKKKV